MESSSLKSVKVAYMGLDNAGKTTIINFLEKNLTLESVASRPEPEKIPRPAEERVVDALKRLSATYPMLDKKKLLDKASELVAQHVMFGKPAKQVIDEVESIFAAAYEKFVAEARQL